MARKPAAASPLDASARVVLLHGKDAFMRAQHTDALRRALEAKDPDLDVRSFDGATAKAADVLDECRSFGLMAAHKLVIVDNAEAFVKEETRPLLERYCQGPGESATLVLRAERWYKGKLDDMIGRVGAIVKCDVLSASGAAEWAVAHAGVHAATLDRATAQRLVDRVGPDTGRLAGEIGKLAIAAAASAGRASKNASITASLIDELVGETREEDAWAFQETLARGSAEEILAGLSRLLDNAPRDTAVLVTIAMIDLARKLHALGAAGQSARSVAGRLKIWPPDKAAALIERASRAQPERLRGLVHAAVEADQRQKSGLGTSHRTLERLALRFARL